MPNLDHPHTVFGDNEEMRTTVRGMIDLLRRAGASARRRGGAHAPDTVHRAGTDRFTRGRSTPQSVRNVRA